MYCTLIEYTDIRNRSFNSYYCTWHCTHMYKIILGNEFKFSTIFLKNNNKCLNFPTKHPVHWFVFEASHVIKKVIKVQIIISPSFYATQNQNWILLIFHISSVIIPQQLPYSPCSVVTKFILNVNIPLSKVLPRLHCTSKMIDSSSEKQLQICVVFTNKRGWKLM